MSLYILPENQRILWETISKVPAFQQWEPVLGNKVEWFQQIIQQFYNNNRMERLNKDSLQQLNKKTLMFMKEQLKTSHFQQSSSHFSGTSISSFSPMSNYHFPENDHDRKRVSRDYMAEQKQLELNQQFLNRQKDYEQKSVVPEMDFREKTIQDTPIENMEDLVKQHLKMREMDIPTILPQPQTQPQIPQILSISSSEPDSPLNVVELDSNSPKKKVQWEDTDVNGDPITLKQLYMEIQELKKEIVDLKKLQEQ